MLFKTSAQGERSVWGGGTSCMREGAHLHWLPLPRHGIHWSSLCSSPAHHILITVVTAPRLSFRLYLAVPGSIKLAASLSDGLESQCNDIRHMTEAEWRAKCMAFNQETPGGPISFKNEPRQSFPGTKMAQTSLIFSSAKPCDSMPWSVLRRLVHQAGASWEASIKRHSLVLCVVMPKGTCFARHEGGVPICVRWIGMRAPEEVKWPEATSEPHHLWRAWLGGTVLVELQETLLLFMFSQHVMSDVQRGHVCTVLQQGLYSHITAWYLDWAALGSDLLPHWLPQHTGYTHSHTNQPPHTNLWSVLIVGVCQGGTNKHKWLPFFVRDQTRMQTNTQKRLMPPSRHTNPHTHTHNPQSPI